MTTTTIHHAMNLNVAHHNVTAAAERHQALADQCRALAPLIKAISQPMAAPMPIELMAQALRPFGICLVHEHTLRQARDYIATDQSDDGLSSDDYHRLLSRLNEALTTEKPSDLIG